MKLRVFALYGAIAVGCSTAAGVAAAAAPGLDPASRRIHVDTSHLEVSRPELTLWSETVGKLCQEWLPMICSTLDEPDIPGSVTIRLVPGRGGHAEGTLISIGVDDVLRNPTDYGAVIHELTHVVQAYRYGWFRNKGIGWLVEGLADYVRFYHYEKDPRRGDIQAGKSKYDDGYRTTAAFLNYIVSEYDARFVMKVHRCLREGRMSRSVFDNMLAEDSDIPVASRRSREVLFARFIEANEGTGATR